MRRSPRSLLLVLSPLVAAMLGMLAGCEPPVSGPPEPAAKVTIRLVDRDGYDKVVAAHQGKVVLVDFWATWCEPCVEKFPHTVEWARKYADAGLVAVSVSLDDPSEQAKALIFLKQQRAEFDNLITTYGVGTEVDTQFELQGAGVPHYKLYDRSGKLRHVFSDGLEEPFGEKTDRIEIRIKELLEEKPEQPKVVE